MSRIPQALWRRKRFFFEKKKQKTFAIWPGGWNGRRARTRSFFASFFSKKEVLAFIKRSKPPR
jgi:hypothetical protein